MPSYRPVDDRIAGVVLTFTGITARKQAEQALRASEERVRLVVDSMPHYAIITLDRDGRIMSWNRGASEMFGYTDREAIGEPIDLIFSPEDRQAGVPAREMAVAREEGRSLDERWHVHKDGRRFFASGVMAPLVSGDALIGYTKVARDLTQRVQVEEELRLAREELEARVEERTRQLAETNEALRRESAERANAEETRSRLMRQLVRAQEDERRRMSRELHDQLGQYVTAIALKLSALKNRPDIAPELRGDVNALQQIVRKLDSDVEFLVWKLRPTGLDDLGLTEALADYVASWSRHFEIPAHFESTLTTRLPAAVETVFYRIAQEALNNVAKHSRATQVEVLLAREGDRVVLTVQDNGVGFDAQAPVDPKSLGMVGLRERASLVGAEMTIDSRPGAGTVVRVSLAA